MAAAIDALLLVSPKEAGTDDGATAPGKPADLGAQKDNIDQLSEISKNSQTTFLAVIVACAYSFLTIATTTDSALLSNSNATALPLLQANVPVVWFYYVGPVILVVLFIYFHLYLGSFWRGLARLPLKHPDGRGLDDYIYPWLISCALIRGQIRSLSSTGRTSARLEAWVSLFLGWGLVPLVLLFYWGRYVVAHDWLGTGLHIALVLLSFSAGLAFLFVSRNALAQIGGAQELGPDAMQGRNPALSTRQRIAVAATTAVLGGVLTYLSAAAFYSPATANCEQAAHDVHCRRFGTALSVWRSLRQEPHAEVSDVRFVPRPANWLQLVNDPVGLRTYLEGQRPLVINGKDLRYLRAAGAFMPGSQFSESTLDRADLRQADLTASRFNNVSLRGADLTAAVLQRAEFKSSQLELLSAVNARFDQAMIFGTEAAPTRMSGDFSNASFSDAKIQQLRVLPVEVDDSSTQTKFIGATLQSVRFGFPTFSMVDFSEAQLLGAHIDHGAFVDVDFSGTKIRDTSFNFSTFTRCRFNRALMDQVYFEEAGFINSVLGTPREAPTGDDAATLSRSQPRELVTAFHAVLAKFDAQTRIVNLEFRGADLRDTHFDRTQFDNVLFTDADLSNAHFDKVNFASVAFARVDLSGADLSSSIGLTPALLAGACGSRETKLPPGSQVARCRPGKRT